MNTGRYHPEVPPPPRHPDSPREHYRCSDSATPRQTNKAEQKRHGLVRRSVPANASCAVAREVALAGLGDAEDVGRLAAKILLRRQYAPARIRINRRRLNDACRD